MDRSGYVPHGMVAPFPSGTSFRDAEEWPQPRNPNSGVRERVQDQAVGLGQGAA